MVVWQHKRSELEKKRNKDWQEIGKENWKGMREESF
jgi:hypothetical protein